MTDSNILQGVPADTVFVIHFIYHVYNDGNPFLKHYMCIPLPIYSS
jgi:hypothetical protein